MSDHKRSLLRDATRRTFLRATAATTVGSYFVSNIGTQSGWASDFKALNEQPGIGFIGCGIRFHGYHAQTAMGFGPCIAVCDVDSVQLGRALQVCMERHRADNRPIDIRAYEDYRKVIDHPDVDVVVVGTVDHWHTKVVIDAMKAGKDVYCEKPVTLTIEEGRQILNVQKETGRTVQVGTQQRTEFGGMFARAVAMMHDGRIGKPELTTVAIGGSRVSGVLPICKPPQSLNWDMWQGQCAEQPYRAMDKVVDTKGWGAGFPLSRAHRYYRWFYEYSGGKLTDWGAHHVDIAMWALRKMGNDIGPITIDPLEYSHPVEFKNGMPMVNDQFNCATSFKVKCTFDDGTVMMVRDSAQEDKGFGNGIMFEGDKGRFIVNRGKIQGRPVDELKENPLPESRLDDMYAFDYEKVKNQFGKNGFHMKDFMESAKEKRKPASDMKSHHEMLSVCHSINIAMRLGKKITYDPKSESFGSDTQANSFVSREQRKGYEIEA